MITIIECLEKLGYSTLSKSTYNDIQNYLSWYKGKIESFHSYKVYNGIALIGKERKSLGMAKTICEDWANLLLNEKVKITMDENANKKIKQVFELNKFSVKGNQLIELTYALGTGAFVEYLDNENVIIDYIQADMIFPLSWDNGEIIECAFGSEKTELGSKKIYIQIHKIIDNFYVIENHMFDAEKGVEIDLPDGLKPEINTNSQIPLFQIIKPNIINNKDLSSPMGISVYANAIDQLKGCDIIYDSFINEFDLGKKRIIVPMTYAKVMQTKDGTSQPIFDNNDATFYAISDTNNNQKIEEIDMTIRAEEHKVGIERTLDLLSFKCGMGTGRYKFENGVVKTATEVISDKSDLYQSLTKHEIILENALINLCGRILFLLGEKTEDIKIDFDDSIIEDKNTEREEDRKDVAMGSFGLDEYRAKYRNEDIEQARKNLPQTADIIME